MQYSGPMTEEASLELELNNKTADQGLSMLNYAPRDPLSHLCCFAMPLLPENHLSFKLLPHTITGTQDVEE